MWKYNGEIIRRPKEMVIGGIKYPQQIFRDNELLLSLGIKKYNLAPFNETYYTKGALTEVETSTTWEATYEAIPKDLEELKLVTKAKVSTKYKVIMERPSVDTGLGFSVDGGYADLQNFQIGKEFGLPQVKDVDGVFHDVTAEDYDTIITAIKTRGLELYNEKWLAEQEVEAIATLEELIAYDKPISEGM